MKDLIELLNRIEKRPFMYIKNNDIYLLESFITGFFVCESFNNLISNRDQIFKDEFYYWLKDKFNFDSSLSWSEMIKKISKEERNDDEIGIFFREYNLFNGRI